MAEAKAAGMRLRDQDKIRHTLDVTVEVFELQQAALYQGLGVGLKLLLTLPANWEVQQQDMASC